MKKTKTLLVVIAIVLMIAIVLAGCTNKGNDYIAEEFDVKLSVNDETYGALSLTKLPKKVLARDPISIQNNTAKIGDTTITANGAFPYSFVKWQFNGKDVDSREDFSDIISKESTLKAFFGWVGT